MESFSEFLNKRISLVVKNKSNCVGTALYLVGEEDSDQYLSRDESRKKLSKMKRVIKPELGSLVLWESGGIPFHAGVIVMENPFYILYRDKRTELLMRESLESFSDYLFKSTGLKPTYRISNKLPDRGK